MEIPNFLIEMSKQMNDQDNRCTADPIWEVRCKRKITCCEGREDYWVIVDVGNEYEELYSSSDCETEYFFEYMHENYDRWIYSWEEHNEKEFNAENFDIDSDYCDLPDGYDELERIPMQEIEETVKSCLTEHDARAFIKRKQHDYPRLYTYVNSMVFCPQMIELRKWILGLADGK